MPIVDSLKNRPSFVFFIIIPHHEKILRSYQVHFFTSGGHYKKVISQVYSSFSSIHSDVADLLATFLDSPKGRKLLPKINEKISNKILNELICNI
jgi:hypothetical protein